MKSAKRLRERLRRVRNEYRARGLAFDKKKAGSGQTQRFYAIAYSEVLSIVADWEKREKARVSR